MAAENSNNIKSEIIKTANLAGYDYAILAGYWDGYDVYEPIYWSDVITDTGAAAFILVKDDEIRRTKDNEETSKVIDEMKSWLDDELEIKPLEIEPNITIKSFEFARGGQGGNFKLFEYSANEKGNILTYTEKGEAKPSLPPAKVKIDDEKFNEYVVGMIKYFCEENGGALGYCEGEFYEFSADLSDGRKLKSDGYNSFPFGYNKFIAFLEHYWDDTNNIIEYLPMKRFENAD
ncbi:MAG: hypothetical protein K6C94_07525 [Candidatus Gastranaerophilales bacterium]|nr:hypothetical protein [Candidatus Gastranaerophilales bacterium]